MDEDSKIIEELRQHVEYQKATISNLERALGQTRASQEEIKMMNDHELRKSKEVIEDLKKKLTSFMSAIDAKNTEILNLQTALGQYYAEIEAKVFTVSKSFTFLYIMGYVLQNAIFKIFHALLVKHLFTGASRS